MHKCAEENYETSLFRIKDKILYILFINGEVQQ